MSARIFSSHSLCASSAMSGKLTPGTTPVAMVHITMLAVVPFALRRRSSAAVSSGSVAKCSAIRCALRHASSRV